MNSGSCANVTSCGEKNFVAAALRQRTTFFLKDPNVIGKVRRRDVNNSWQKTLFFSRDQIATLQSPNCPDSIAGDVVSTPLA